LAVDYNGANQLVFFDHRDGKHCPCACELGKLRSSCTRRGIGVTRLVLDIADLNCPLRRQRASERCFGVRADYWIAPPRFGKRCRCTVHSNCTKGIAFAEVECSELGLADTGCIRQHGLEYGLEIARRT